MLTLKNLKIYTDEGIVDNGYIKFDDVIREIGSGEVEGIDMHGELLIPGYIDQHSHGLMGHDVMDGTKESIFEISKQLPLEGTTSFLATTMTDTVERIENALQNISNYIRTQEKGHAEVVGVHLEGPFISEVYKGAQRGDAIQDVSVELFNKYNKAAMGMIKQVTIAPELEKADELIAHLSKSAIVASIGHTDTSGEEALKAIENGARCFTHAYNGMSKLHHRDIGAVGAMLLSDDTYAELICDKIHVSDEATRLLYKTKTSDYIILITDGMRAKLLGDGDFDLGGQVVTVKDGQARLSSGVLAGSTLYMDDAVRNIISITECGIYDCIKMASMNPAKLHGLYHKKGSITVGKDADLLVVDSEMNLIETYCKGIKRLK